MAPMNTVSSPTRAALGAYVDDPCITENRLACYVPALLNCDEMFRLLRIVLHGFGTVWRDADNV